MDKRKPHEFEIGEALDAFVSNLRLNQGLNQVKIREVWLRLMGAPIASRTKKILLINQKLIITVDSPALRHELSMATSKIMDIVNESLGEEAVSEVILR